jgi:hypothetical protein
MLNTERWGGESTFLLIFTFDNIKHVITLMIKKSSLKTHLNTKHHIFNMETHMGEKQK